jgi:glycosyltransferase involved in cell wall biosynthesis
MNVTIIIPVYKVESYIRDCLYSVMAQTMSKGLECILVDDSTPDKSIVIAESVIADYDGEIKFRVLYHDQNKGLSEARNTGMLAALGKYIYFLDSDDTIIPKCIELLYALVENYPGVDMVQGGTNCSIDWLSFADKSLPEYSNNRRWIKTTMLKRYILPMIACNKLLRRQFITDNNLFFSEGIIHEDEHFNFFLAKHISSVAVCKYDTYLYRHNPNGIKLSSANEKETISWTFIINDMIANLDSFCRTEQVMCILNKLQEICNDGMNDITNKIVENKKFEFRKLWQYYCNYNSNLKKMYRLKNRILLHLWMTLI